MLQINLLPLRDPTGVEQPFTTRDFLPDGRTTNPMESNEVHITYTFVDESGSPVELEEFAVSFFDVSSPQSNACEMRA